ncbi:hypothetical protein BHE74_00047703 [Ensete ventricosum]|nr:hypothetical protein GW17_00004758 [Ensete ventricosum]RWW46370.1 hypothetical protein BHE74_00047703 [Ensete ventricosum]
MVAGDPHACSRADLHVPTSEVYNTEWYRPYWTIRVGPPADRYMDRPLSGEEEEEGEEKGEPGDPTPLSLDDLDPSLPSLARPRRRENVASDQKREATLPRAAS